MSVRRWMGLLLAVALWLYALVGIPKGTAIELRWVDTDIWRSAFESALKQSEQPVRAVVWALKRVEKQTVAVYSGDALLLTGDLMSRGSAAVCAVSESVARAMWGSVDVVGLSLALGGTTYAVSGVYASGVADVLLPWDGAMDAQFRQMAVRFPGEPDGAQYSKALDFASAMGMGAPDDALDAPLLCGMVRALAWIPGLGLMLLAIIWQRRMLRGMIRMRAAVFALSLMALVLALGSNLVPPKWLLPSRWSDFAHWAALAGEIADRLSDFQRAAQNSLNGHVFYACLRASAMGLVSMALLLGIRGGWNHEQDVGRADAGLGVLFWGMRRRARDSHRAGARSAGDGGL